MEGGSAHGVTAGAEFSIHPDQESDTPYDLFPNLFYFDNSDVSIGKWFAVCEVY